MSDITPRELEVARQELQQHISGIESRLRRRLGGRFRALRQSGYDIDDVLSSARRRADSAIVEGRLDHPIGNLDAYVSQVAEHVALEAIRRIDKAQRDSTRRVAGDKRPDDASNQLGDVLSRLDARDRQAAELWARGLSHAVIAEMMGVSLAAHRSRWQRICRRSRSPGRLDP